MPCVIHVFQIRKPLVEKRRRDRMNASLEQLKSLLAVNIKQTVSGFILHVPIYSPGSIMTIPFQDHRQPRYSETMYIS